jgi:hypothetical protein
MTHRIDRFLVPVLPALALLAGIGAVWTRALPWQWMLRGLLVVGLAANFVTITCGLGADNRFFASYDTLRYDPDRTDPWHLWLEEHVPPGKQVLLVGDAQPFDLEVPAIYSTTFDMSPFEEWVYRKTPDEVEQKFAEEGISHIYVRWDEIKRYQSPSNYGFSSFVAPTVFQELIEFEILDDPTFDPKSPTRMVYPVRPPRPKDGPANPAQQKFGATAPASANEPSTTPTPGTSAPADESAPVRPPTPSDPPAAKR